MADDGKYKLTCLIEGDKTTFSVLVPRTADVEELKELVYKKGETTDFRGLHAKNIDLLKVC
jgi:hypothetical protein